MLPPISAANEKTRSSFLFKTERPLLLSPLMAGESISKETKCSLVLHFLLQQIGDDSKIRVFFKKMSSAITTRTHLVFMVNVVGL